MQVIFLLWRQNPMRISHWGHSNLTVVQTGEFPSTVVTRWSTFVLTHSLIVRAAGSCRAVITTCPVRNGNPGENNYDMPRVTPQTRVIAWWLNYVVSDSNLIMWPGYLFIYKGQILFICLSEVHVTLHIYANVNVYSPDVPSEFSRPYNLHPGTWTHSLTVSSLLGRIQQLCILLLLHL